MSKAVISRLPVKIRDWMLGRPQHQSKSPDPIYSDDVFFVSYPRSGSSWLRRLVGIALHPEFPQEVYRNINELIPDMYVMGQHLANYPRPRMIKSHEPHHPLYPKVVYLYRDARDVVPSYYDFYRTIKHFAGGLDEFLTLFLTGRVDFGRWDSHIRSWLTREPSSSFLTISYEQLCAATDDTVASVLGFLGYTVPGDTIRKAVEECTFARHQSLVRESNPSYSTGYRGGVAGKPGRGRATLSERQLAVLWDEMGATLELLHYRR